MWCHAACTAPGCCILAQRCRCWPPCCRRHPASGYVQGINDLVTPFMAVFMSEHIEGPMEGWSVDGCSEELLLDVEADCYW